MSIKPKTLADIQAELIDPILYETCIEKINAALPALVNNPMVAAQVALDQPISNPLWHRLQRDYPDFQIDYKTSETRNDTIWYFVVYLPRGEETHYIHKGSRG
jgi:hypothetical protein